MCALLPSVLWGQLFTKNDIAPLTCTFVAGAADGLAETLRYHYPQFKAIHPNANDQYWNPSLGWKNKYMDYDNDDLRERFLFSSTALVSLTDGFHMTRMVRNTGIKAAIVFKIGEKITWRSAAKDMVLYSVAYGAGFWVTYEIIYK